MTPLVCCEPSCIDDLKLTDAIRYCRSCRGWLHDRCVPKHDGGPLRHFNDGDVAHAEDSAA